MANGRLFQLVALVGTLIVAALGFGVGEAIEGYGLGVVLTLLFVLVWMPALSLGKATLPPSAMPHVEGTQPTAAARQGRFDRLARMLGLARPHTAGQDLARLRGGAGLHLMVQFEGGARPAPGFLLLRPDGAGGALLAYRPLAGKSQPLEGPVGLVWEQVAPPLTRRFTDVITVRGAQTELRLRIGAMDLELLGGALGVEAVTA
ncbi:hypothetical protein GCM10018781_80180 [Kitasatospora indigofera]|uniref:Uncharacterized protein n=1 Tax=Kitasatospora indigofera TaxID=67307 RepID=A0A918YXC0_9ACTN|nr:hypothetical protein [Kitasatospora indigofera]GHE27575.1 hypothetical protein GCM10018781_80180 [Kitasatospora indigofera]